MTLRSIGGEEDALKHETRKAVFETLKRFPGLGVSQLCKILNVNRGTISHHLAVLQRSGLVGSQRVSKYTLYTIQPPSGKIAPQGSTPKPEAIAALRRRGGTEIASNVLQQPGLIQKDLTASTGMNRKVLRPLLNLMVQSELILEQKHSRSCRYFPTRLLETVLAYIGKPEVVDHGAKPMELHTQMVAPRVQWEETESVGVVSDAGPETKSKVHTRRFDGEETAEDYVLPDLG